ncbi:hypothetical protein F511_30413 [Dorcoceras hygrometricum]|uniref:Uncharacterized protein n=1 Tax=Dorcoceras hygrometricum TaxID=472368 RepID=A0A2Z7D191_9LAMI|nr:hypothetical protein F511_30413 [Dorcoceras hygrometricum]
MSFYGEILSFPITILDVPGLNQNSRDSCCGNRCTELSVYSLMLCAYTDYITCISDLNRIVPLYLVVMCCCFLPGSEGERRYRTLISLLGSVSHHAPSG